MPRTDMSAGHVISFTSHLSKAFVVVLAAVTALAALAAPAGAAEETSTVVRIAGDDRVDTAVSVSRASWSDASHAVLTTGDSYPDALAATAYAAATHAPILLTSADGLPGSVAEELQRLGADRVTILGGARAVSDEVQRAVADVVPDVERIAGDSRYDTARLLALRTGAGSGGKVALALGTDSGGVPGWPDALSAGSLAAVPDPIPTLLTASGELPDATRAALQEIQPNEVLLIGGENAVSTKVASQVEELGLSARRVSGSNRYRTSVAVARETLDTGVPADDFVFVSGERFADALAAAAFAANEAAPMLLVPSTRLANGVDEYLRTASPTFDDGLLVGGSRAVDDFVKSEIHASLRGLDRPQPEPEPEPEPEPAAPSYGNYEFRFDLGIWDRLAQCESGGNWSINTGNGYYGGIQFSLASWRAVGGSGYPHHASRHEQIYRGELLQAKQGWGAWPACTRKMGLR